MKKNISYIIASFFGTGYSPKASGTVGSLATLPVAFVVAYFFGFVGILTAAALSFVFGTLASREVLKYTEHDPSLIVIDEVCGQLLAFLFVAQILQGACNVKAFVLYAVGFALFRLFDITKPSIIGWADKKLENAYGVMLDDVFAGLFAAVLLLIVSCVI